MTILNATNPPLNEALEHHGVKGMKWGVTRSKPSSAQIKDARARVGSQVRQINAQIDRANLSSGKSGRRESQKLGKMMTSHLKNPDRATALRLTRGEKAALGILAVGLPGAGTGAAAGYAGTRVLIRKSIEKQQRNA